MSFEAKLKDLAGTEADKDGFHPGMKSSRTAIELEFGMYLHDQVRRIRPDLMVEIGTGAGYSTSWLLLGLLENGSGQLVTVDEKKPESGFLWDQLEIPRDRLTFVNGTAREYLSLYSGEPIDMLFLDADHTIDGIVKSIELLDPMISGKVFVHDVNYCRETGDLLKDYFLGIDSPKLWHCGVNGPSRYRWHYEELGKSSGMGVATKERADDVAK
jgi:hypothetical protein